MKAQQETELRRLSAAIAADQAALKLRRDEYEARFDAAPAADWHEVVEKIRYLLLLFADTPAADAPRRQQLISEALADIDRLDKLTPDTEIS